MSSISPNSSVEINSKVNEIYAKTKVTQKLTNSGENPLELKIYVYNTNTNLIFSSFSAKIGDSIEVKSKVIKQSKAEEKYTDSISSGNAAIFVSKDPKNKNRIIINMGNIPPKQEVIFISEFIQFVETSDFYEFELFRNLPIFKGKDTLFQNSEIKGTIEINTKSKINKIQKEFLSHDKLNIIEEKFLDENKYSYLIKYEYKNLPELYLYNPVIYPDIYIQSNRIYFEKENNAPLCIYQKSPKENEINYIIQYKNIINNSSKENLDNILNPSLFIFLIDQSYSMEGHSMEVAIKALILFLQSLPAGSYYQIIGFGSKYEIYDPIPKEYTQKNIKESINFVGKLEANKGGTNIYAPLKYIYSFKSFYDTLQLPKNIFLLTDGEVLDKKNTLDIIEENSDDFFVYSIGIGDEFDKDLIKNAGVLGKGNYNFCADIKDLKEIIVNEIKNCSKPSKHDFEFKTNLDENNLYKMNNKINVLRENQIVNIKYIVENKGEIEKNIKLNLKYEFYHKKEKTNEETNENYEITSEEIQTGDELSKLIMNNYISNNDNLLSKDEKIKLALKYQIFTDYTSLFAEVELSHKITEEMKKEIIGDEENNVITKPKKVDNKKEDDENDNHESELNDIRQDAELISLRKKELKDLPLQGSAPSLEELVFKATELESNSVNFYTSAKKASSISESIGGFFKSIGNSIKGIFWKNEPSVDNNNNDNNNKLDDKYENKIKDNEIINQNKISNNKKNEIKQNNEINIEEIVNEQNFVEGFWEINEITKKIKEKYENEFKLLKGIKDKNINDNIAITILIIYFINKEHSELLKELFMIIEKAKNYIKKNTKDVYDNIIKEIGI